jgi:hypothetical protein
MWVVQRRQYPSFRQPGLGIRRVRQPRGEQDFDGHLPLQLVIHRQPDAAERPLP